MAIEEIKAAITEFINVIEKPKETVAEREKALAIALDKLILYVNFIPEISNNYDGGLEPPEFDDVNIRESISKLFPNFGFYNAPNVISQNVAGAELVVADAIDDVYDIYNDLKDLQWRFKNTSDNDAVWYLGNVNWHWLQHAHFLRLYIFSNELGF